MIAAPGGTPHDAHAVLRARLIAADGGELLFRAESERNSGRGHTSIRNPVVAAAERGGSTSVAVPSAASSGRAGEAGDLAQAAVSATRQAMANRGVRGKGRRCTGDSSTQILAMNDSRTAQRALRARQGREAIMSSTVRADGPDGRAASYRLMQ